MSCSGADHSKTEAEHSYSGAEHCRSSDELSRSVPSTTTRVPSTPMSIEFASPPSDITEFVDAFHEGEEVRFHRLDDIVGGTRPSGLAGRPRAAAR